MDNRIRVFLVDDHAVVRAGLTAILGREPDLSVVGEASAAEEALHRMQELEPDVVILDHRLPGMSGIELCREMAERRLRTQVVILSAFLERNVVESALRAGARAYVVKDIEAGELKRAIRAAAEGKTTIDPMIPASFRGDQEVKQISPRHLRVLSALAEGRSAPAIGELLGLSLHTVKSYMREIYADLGVNSRAEAIAVAARRGFV